MATLLKKGRKKATDDSVGAPMPEAVSAEAVAEAQPAPEYEPAPPAEHTPSTAVVSSRKPPQPPGPPVDTTPFISYPPPDYTGPVPANFPRSYGNATPYDVGADYAPPDGAEDFQLPNRYIPAEPPPSPEPPAPKGGLLQRVLLFSGETKPEERDRVAQEEFQQAIEPVMEYMRVQNPDASTPEEAAQIWAENQGEITPDPNGGSYVRGDAFDRDARVYYRLLRRDYEKSPRPSEKEKRTTSHHLHGAYGKLPGTRGW